MATDQQSTNNLYREISMDCNYVMPTQGVFIKLMQSLPHDTDLLQNSPQPTKPLCDMYQNKW